MTRSRGISYQALLDSDTHPVPDVLRLDEPLEAGPQNVPIERYTSRDFHLQEVEKIWQRVWQMACREEDIPEVGDYLVYDIAGLSFLMVRSAPDEIKGFWNACLHKARRLRESRGHASKLRCPNHGWCWKLSGKLDEIPCSWDFPHVDKAEHDLPEVRVATWGGFVFINPDPGAESFEDFAGDLAQHFERWPLEDRYKAVHVAKIIRCNWKIAQEAFMEAYHVVATHPQLLPSIGDSNSQYDVFGNFSRAITPNGTPSPHLAEAPSEQQMVNNLLDADFDAAPIMKLPEGTTARETIAATRRGVMRQSIGDAVDSLSDAELMDSFYYTLFPNFHPWAAYNRIVYRFRPNGDDHESSIMECMYLEPLPDGPRPAAAQIHWLGPDDDWVEASELGGLARVFNQDVFNLEQIQLGMKTTRKTHTNLGNYNEAKLRHYHLLADEWMARD
jgi:phenylpropionate dioxygenase-like ring-hydroxylating dioxygenase large terminal subunit